MRNNDDRGLRFPHDRRTNDRVFHTRPAFPTTEKNHHSRRPPTHTWTAFTTTEKNTHRRERRPQTEQHRDPNGWTPRTPNYRAGSQPRSMGRVGKTTQSKRMRAARGLQLAKITNQSNRTACIATCFAHRIRDTSEPRAL